MHTDGKTLYQEPVPISGVPKFTKQKLVCSKLSKNAGLMICAHSEETKRGARLGDENNIPDSTCS